MFQTFGFRCVDILDGLKSLSDLVFLTGSKSVLTFAIDLSTFNLCLIRVLAAKHLPCSSPTPIHITPVLLHP